MELGFEAAALRRRWAAGGHVHVQPFEAAAGLLARGTVVSAAAGSRGEAAGDRQDGRAARRGATHALRRPSARYRNIHSLPGGNGDGGGQRPPRQIRRQITTSVR